jgi:hypothetical protein
MSRRFASLSLLCAWLCASGAMLDVAQTLAWARMFAGYARCEAVSLAARETFDPSKPCAICIAVGKAREASGGHAPVLSGSATDRIVLILESPLGFIPQSIARPWPASRPVRPQVLTGDVPVPPPRGPASSDLA